MYMFFSTDFAGFRKILLIVRSCMIFGRFPSDMYMYCMYLLDRDNMYFCYSVRLCVTVSGHVEPWSSARMVYHAMGKYALLKF